MPLLQNKPIVLHEHDESLARDKPVWRVRFTGEVYESYEEYLNRIDFYSKVEYAIG